MATLARSMPQFGLLIALILLPMQMPRGRPDTTREHAALRTKRDGARADNAFRLRRPGGPLPGCRFRSDLAAVRGTRYDQHRPVWHRAVTIPQNHRSDGVKAGLTVNGWRYHGTQDSTLRRDGTWREVHRQARARFEWRLRYRSFYCCTPPCRAI